MRHFSRLNRVACGILGRWHPSVLTLLAQKTADFRQDLGRRAPRVIYCASVSPNLRCVSTIVRPTPTCVSDNVRRKWPSIARRAVHYCAPLHLQSRPCSPTSRRRTARRDGSPGRRGRFPAPRRKLRAVLRGGPFAVWPFAISRQHPSKAGRLGQSG
jgi:hypothetical protein